jgi:hypothetical protein
MPAPFAILNFALSQEDRAAQAADPSRVRVDDRSLAQLLSLAVEHGKLITFHDLTNAPDGDWSALFAADPAIALALQASLDLTTIEREMQAIGQRLRQDQQPLVRPEAWQDLVALMRALLAILRQRPLRKGPLATVLRQVDGPVALIDSATNLARFLEGTGLDLRLGVQPILLKETELRRLENLLRDVLGVLLAALDVARQNAAQELDAVSRRPGHAPHVALYIAFARLFQSTQARLNGFPSALLSFYHQQVLRQDAMADSSLRPDRLLLAFRLKPGAELALVQRQTPFSAGVDGEGLPILYATDEDQEVNAGELRGMDVLRVRGRVLPVAEPNGVVAIDAVWLTPLSLPLPYPANGPLLPLFGPNPPRQTHPGSTRLGFAVASPLLLLEGGERLVRLSLRISTTCLGWLAAAAPSTDRASLPDRILRTLREGLGWAYTSVGALVPIHPEARIVPPGESVSAEPKALTVELAFVLPPSAPPCRACPDRGEQPLLIARLPERDPVDDTAASHSPGSLTDLTVLSLLRLEALRLAVVVQGLEPASLQSTMGRLDPSQPLPIFGPSPVCGSFFSAAVEECAAKPLDAITLKLDWHGLPISRDGFRGHYSGYILDGDGQSHPPGELFANDLFRVDLHLETGSNAAPEPFTLPLFATVPVTDTGVSSPTGATPLASTTVLSVSDLKGLVGVRALRLVLSAPLHAFGDALYATNSQEASRRLATLLMEASTNRSTAANSPSKDSRPDWPNPPWCPRVARVRVDYSCAMETIFLPSAGGAASPLLHLTPFGELLPGTEPEESGMPLLSPLLDGDDASSSSSAPPPKALQTAMVVLTLSQPIHQVSLLFGLTTSGIADSLGSCPTTRVEAWIGGTWMDVPAEGVQDGTSGLSRTGLLRLRLPKDHTSARLRLRARGPAELQTDLVCLEPNATWATWQGPGGRLGLNRSLEAGQVSAALVNLPAIAEVRQPLPSAGGVAPASEAMAKVCLAERMRHKERAIQGDDYALLLLRAFPFLWQVAVLPACDANGTRAAGCVTIIPIPGPDAPTIPDPTIPSCDAAFSEKALAELRPRLSPFARVQVACPPYRRLRVSATVVVADEARLATTLQQLQADLVRFLSPWPAPDLGQRPKNYFEESAISQFIRDRPYIQSIDSLTLTPVDLHADERQDKQVLSTPAYYTSALNHDLQARPASVALASAKDKA